MIKGILSEDELNKLKKKADDGSTDAMVSFGNYYMYHPLCPNEKLGFYYYQKAADMGNPYGEIQLGIAFYFGNGVKPDKNMAVKLVKDAADKGVAKAQCFLGMLYKEGEIGYFATETKMFQCFEKAAKQGYARAQIELGDIYMFKKHSIDNALFWWACAYVHGKNAMDESNMARDRMNDAVESGMPGGYDRVNSFIEKVKNSQYLQYTQNPR